MRLFTAICVLALVAAFAVPAFAETQNIKVSGDIKVAHVYLKDIDLDENDGDEVSDNQNFFVQQVGLNVEADLTDNVATYVRLISEREWTGEAGGANTYDVTLDEAYVTLKEMLYAPLTLKIGRQNIWLGKGFVVGNSGALVWDSNATLPVQVHELSDNTAFDSVRATLDYDPWTIDLIYAKVDENVNLGGDPDNYDDKDLYVVNLGYDFEKNDAEAEAYYILKWDRSNTPAATGFDDTDDIHTVGLRGSLVPFDMMNIWAEGAFQFGTYKASSAAASRDREAFAINIGGDYTLADVKWTPTVGLEYTLWSGEGSDNAGDWNAWDPLYPGKFDTNIAAFRNITKVTAYGAQMGLNDHGATNENQFAAFASLEPMTDITLSGKFTYLWFDEVPVSGGSDDIGYEIDGKVVYDYTEDVQFSIAGAVFIAEDFYPDGQDDTATQLVSAVTVDF